MRRRLRGFGVLAALLAVASACGGGSSGTAEEADRNAIVRFLTDYATAGASGTVVFDSLVYRGGLPPWMPLMYDTIVRSTPDGLKPGLAREWSFPDEKTIQLTLRSGVKFQDGTPLNAAAVKFSFERIMATPSTTMTKIAGTASLESVEAVGDDKVIVRLSRPLAADFRDRLLFETSHIDIVSPTAVAKLGAGFSAMPLDAGAGPYKLVEYQANQRISLRRWDGYWDPDSQKLGGIDFVNASAGASTMTALLGGTGDVAVIGTSDLAPAQARGFEISEALLSTGHTSMFMFCTTRAPFDSLKVRQAVAYATNRQDYVTTVFGGHAKASAFMPVENFPNFPKGLSDPYAYNLDKAKSLIREAGVVPGTKVRLLVTPSPDQALSAQVFQDQMKAIGLDVQITSSPTAFADVKSVIPDVYMLSANGPIATQPSSFFFTGGVGNFCTYNNTPTVDAFGRARSVLGSDEARMQAWKDFQTALWADLPAVAIAGVPLITAHSKNVKGFGPIPIYQGNPAAWASIYVTK